MVLMQGNTYRLPIRIKMDGAYLTADDVVRVEFAIGNLLMCYPETVRYDDGAFWLPLSQKDTFALSGWLRYQVRVLFPDGSVKASAICGGIVSDSISKEVLA